MSSIHRRELEWESTVPKMAEEIGVVLKRGAPEAFVDLDRVHQAAPDAKLLIEAEGHHAVDVKGDHIERVDGMEMQERCSLMVVLGGDGTLIHAASLLRDRVVPILGINLGHIGFLTDVTRDELPKALEMARAGKLPHLDRMRLDVDVTRGGEVVLQRRVLNDAVLAPSTLSRIATYRLTWQGELVTTVRGDGVIVSTPTGSTAYALAAGGSVLVPGLQAITIVPICPHQITQRPIILNEDGELTVGLESDSHVAITCDGQAGMPFEPGDVMALRKAPVPSRILTVPWRDFFGTLRTKLNWGGGDV